MNTIKKAVVRVNGKINKTFEDSNKAASFARFLIETGTKKEEIRCRWELLAIHEKARTNGLQVIQDVDGREIYNAVTDATSDYYIQIDLSEMIYANLYFKKYRFQSDERMYVECLKTYSSRLPDQNKPSNSHRAICSQEKWDAFELAGKILANI